ncbi:hypothetical protein P6P90_10205 [Ectobacillus antri]|uniref:ABC transporter permease n=1 Tax=Ectobacillus antri TaxID=2486280 RepID=A0ABT6H7J2_9BACI|nr:hypothetical protein [Ectobacillus antri]MDG4657307.1 hypothetical protein [Ectobacillus antri]MDG5754341.1 hypothetical protein [Ectobacillus antri]
MQSIFRKRLINRYSISSFTFFTFTLFISFFLSSSIIESIFLYDYSSGDLAGKGRLFLAKNYFSNATWELMVFDSMYYSLFIFTLPATLPVIQFYNEGRGYLLYTYGRVKNYKRMLYKTILLYSFISGLCFACPQLIFYIFTAWFNPNYVNENLGIFKSVSAFLPANDAISYFIYVCFIVNFLFGFIYGFFACAVALWTEKAYFVVLIPFVYYLVLSNLAASFHLELVSPLLGILYNSYSDVSISQISVPLLIPLLMGILLIMLHLRKGDKFGI